MRILLEGASMPRRARPLLLAALSACFLACTTVIHPPLSPADPQTVLLVAHGRSSSLVLPSDEGDAARWAFGDWRYYAEGRKGILNGLRALLWPTPSALGRQVLGADSESREELDAIVGIAIDEVLAIDVGREELEKLERRLESLFAANRETLLYNPGARLAFVRHPKPYSLARNSNGRVAAWLRELGCRTSGIPILPKWSVTRERSTPRAREW